MEKHLTSADLEADVAQWLSTHLRSKTLKVMGLSSAGCWAFPSPSYQ